MCFGNLRMVPLESIGSLLWNPETDDTMTSDGQSQSRRDNTAFQITTPPGSLEELWV